MQCNGEVPLVGGGCVCVGGGVTGLMCVIRKGRRRESVPIEVGNIQLPFQIVLSFRRVGKSRG